MHAEQEILPSSTPAHPPATPAPAWLSSLPLSLPFSSGALSLASFPVNHYVALGTLLTARPPAAPPAAPPAPPAPATPATQQQQGTGGRGFTNLKPKARAQV